MFKNIISLLLKYSYAVTTVLYCTILANVALASVADPDPDLVGSGPFWSDPDPDLGLNKCPNINFLMCFKAINTLGILLFKFLVQEIYF
jgi:hypothetical protein